MVISVSSISDKEKQNTYEENEYETLDYNTIEFIDSDNSSEHIYFDIEATDGEKSDSI